MNPGDIIITRDGSLFVVEKAGPKQIKARSIWLRFRGDATDEDVTATLGKERDKLTASFGRYGAHHVTRDEVRPFTVALWRELRKLQGEVGRTRDESREAVRAAAAPYDEKLAGIRAEIEKVFA